MQALSSPLAAVDYSLLLLARLLAAVLACRPAFSTGRNSSLLQAGTAAA
jgi:hypothetical protein